MNFAPAMRLAVHAALAEVPWRSSHALTMRVGTRSVSSADGARCLPTAVSLRSPAAHADTGRFGRYRDALLQGAVELIQLFTPGAFAKNGDASDFLPAAQKINAVGRTLIGICNRRNTNKHWAKSRHQFRDYDSLVDA